MSGKWSRAGVPHKGWKCIGIEDLKDDRMICEMCETMEIRYAHTMEHDAYPEELVVGCVCAGKMEEDLARARRREGAVKNTASRRARWLGRAWRTSRKGNPFLNTNDGFNVVVFQQGARWGARVEDRQYTLSLFSRTQYESQDEAKLASFDMMVALKAHRIERG